MFGGYTRPAVDATSAPNIVPVRKGSGNGRGAPSYEEAQEDIERSSLLLPPQLRVTVTPV